VREALHWVLHIGQRVPDCVCPRCPDLVCQRCGDVTCGSSVRQEGLSWPIFLVLLGAVFGSGVLFRELIGRWQTSRLGFPSEAACSPAPGPVVSSPLPQTSPVLTLVESGPITPSTRRRPSA